VHNVAPEPRRTNNMATCSNVGSVRNNNSMIQLCLIKAGHKVWLSLPYESTAAVKTTT
jgi:hypothetical protein